MYDPSYPEIDHNVFKKWDWSEFYRDAKEAVPMNAAEPWGKDVDICMFVDSDHAWLEVFHRSKSCFLICVNTALVQWFSKKQSSVESAVFGTKFIAMKLEIDALRGLRYNLRMMGILISVPSYIYVGNMSVVHNTFRTESAFRNKSDSVCYLAVHESVAIGKSLIGHIPSKVNVADLLTKVSVMIYMIYMMMISY